MRVPTVRVTHPVLGFITINASDFTAQHELYGEQAEDFEAATLARPLAPAILDPALRDAAADLCLRMVAFRRRATGEPFAELPDTEQLAVLRGMRAELDQAMADYEDDQRECASFEAAERERTAREQAPDGESQAEPLRVAKGPRGLWFVYRGDERVGSGHQTEDAAKVALAAI